MAGEIVKKEDLSVSNRMLLSYARLSLNEIAEKTGFSPIEAGEKIDELLNNRNRLSMLQQEQLLIMDMQEIVDDARERLSEVSDEFYADIANAVIRAMSGIGTRMDAQRKLIDFNIDQISRAQASVFGQAFNVALWHVIDSLMIEHPDIEKSEVRVLVREGMKLAASSLHEHVNDE